MMVSVIWKKQMDDYAGILILLAGVWFGYLLNDIRRDLKEWKNDKDNK